MQAQVYFCKYKPAKKGKSWTSIYESTLIPVYNVDTLIPFNVAVYYLYIYPITYI